LKEQPRRTSPLGWVVAGLMIFALFVAIVANLQQQQAAQATATAQAQATATAQAQATVQAYNNHPAISAENAFHLQLYQSIDAHSGWISAIDFSPDGLFLASSAWDHTVKLWRVQYGQLMHYLTIYHHSQVEAVVFSPDGKLLASSGCTTEFSIENPCQKGEINLWSLDGNLVRTMTSLQKADLSTTETTEIAETKSNFIFQ
jgi:WD40 repeat protein